MWTLFFSTVPTSAGILPQPLDTIFTILIWAGAELFFLLRAILFFLMPSTQPHAAPWLLERTAPSLSDQGLSLWIEHAISHDLSLVVRNLSDAEWAQLGWDTVSSMCTNAFQSHLRAQVCNERASIWRWAGVRELSAFEWESTRCARTLPEFSKQVRRTDAPAIALFGHNLPGECPHLDAVVRRTPFFKAFHRYGHASSAKRALHRNATRRDAPIDASLGLMGASSSPRGIRPGVRYRLGPEFPSLYLHPAGTMSAAHVDRGASFFWLRMVTGVKRVRVWPLGSPSVSGSAEGRLGDDGAFSSLGALFSRREYREFTLRAGDLWYAPPNLIHAVLTLEPSIMMSANYFADPIRAPTQQREGLNKSRAHTARPHGRASTYANGKRRGTASGAGAKL